MSKYENSESLTSSIETEDVVSDTEINTCLYNDIIDNKDAPPLKILYGSDRITKNKLTRYEFVRIIGERTKQLSMGAKPSVSINKKSEDLEYNEIAIEELKLNMLPFKIKRPLINGYEIWSLDELEKEHLAYYF